MSCLSGPCYRRGTRCYGTCGLSTLFRKSLAATRPIYFFPLQPLRADTFGTGELIKAALDAGAQSLTVGIGGSATTDGGTGMARALGYRFLDGAGNELPPGPEALNRLDKIDISAVDPRLFGAKIKVACDVTNPLLGANGTVAVYGPQKVIKSLGGQCLHAGVLGFRHPITGEYMEFTAPLPEYFTAFVRTLEEKSE